MPDTALPETAAPAPLIPSTRRRNAVLVGAAAAIVLVAVGAGAGALGMTYAGHGRDSLMVPLEPVPTAALADDKLQAVKGEVAEVFGNKFIIQDSSGRALVETGRAGEGGDLVAVKETVTVQGRFENGFMRAGFVVHADGRIDALSPPPPPHRRPGRPDPRG